MSVYVVVVLAGGDAPRAVFPCVVPMKGKHTINYLQYHEYGFGRPSLEREVQWDFRVRSSVAEPIVMSFTVPLNGCTIVATATVVTPCSSSADCPVSAAPTVLRGCLRRDVVWWWRFHS